MSDKLYFNPQHVRSVSLTRHNQCKIEWVRYSLMEVELKDSVYWHSDDPVKFAACVGVHKYFEKQRTQDHV